jgi:hypothetical protein
MGIWIIFRAHLVARRAPRVGLVHERRLSYYGTTQRSHAQGTYEADSTLSLARCPSPPSPAILRTMPLTFASAELIALSLEAVLYGLSL